VLSLGTCTWASTTAMPSITGGYLSRRGPMTTASGWTKAVSWMSGSYSPGA
jgi:hypothetical protein